MNPDLLTQVINADISRQVKENILTYWLLPPSKGGAVAPIKKAVSPSGSVKRPSKEELELRANPKLREEQEEMEQTLEEVVGDGGKT